MDPESPTSPLTDHRALIGYVITGALGGARAFFEWKRRRKEFPSISPSSHQETLKLRLEHIERRQEQLESDTRNSLHDLLEEKQRMHRENQDANGRIFDQLQDQRKVLDQILLARRIGGKHE